MKHTSLKDCKTIEELDNTLFTLRKRFSYEHSMMTVLDREYKIRLSEITESNKYETEDF